MSTIGYGLNLRLPSQQKKLQQQQSTKLPRPPAFGFNNDDEDDVESNISRQASKNKSLKDTEEQQKKSLKEDPTVFYYDGVYDDKKLKAIQPQVQDRQDRMVKYLYINIILQFAEKTVWFLLKICPECNFYLLHKYRNDFLYVDINFSIFKGNRTIIEP